MIIESYCLNDKYRMQIEHNVHTNGECVSFTISKIDDDEIFDEHEITHIMSIEDVAELHCILEHFLNNPKLDRPHIYNRQVI